MTKFVTAFDTLSWDEVPVETTLSSAGATAANISASPSSTLAPKITRVRTERVFHPAGDGGTFKGTAVVEYSLIYDPSPEGTARHEVTANYAGVMFLAGTLSNGAEEWEGSAVFGVKNGRFEGSAKGDWILVQGTTKGEWEGKIKDAKGAYDSKGMTGSASWLEVEFA
ncbi:hypothetical protein T439DRAFT_322388 [Meredithblackwellia eburnea MCA 4105]